MTECEQKQIDAILGKGASFIEYKDVKAFNAGKSAEAMKNGEVWVKDKLSSATGMDVSQFKDSAEAFEMGGDWKFVFSKVYTLVDGTIVAVK